MSDTPETDAMVEASFNRINFPTAPVPAEFARKLERERDDAREKAERYRIEANAMMMQRDEWAAMCGRYKQERDDLQKAINGLCEHFKISPANTTLLAVEVLRIERERDEAREAFVIATDQMVVTQCKLREAMEALKFIDEAIFTMKPRHIGGIDMDGKYPCWSVWLPKSGRVERKSLQDALLEFVAQIKEAVK